MVPKPIQFVLKSVTYNLEYTASNIKYILSLRFKAQEQIIRTLGKTWLLRSLRSFHRSRFLVEQLLHIPRKGCPAKKLYRKYKVKATQMRLVRITWHMFFGGVLGVSMIVSRCTHGGTSISPTDNPNKIVLTCGAALHRERSPTVTLAGILAWRPGANLVCCL